jgi:hypothetical protein
MLAGCDGTGSQRASLYQRLSDEGEGPWRIERLDGPLTPDLGDRDIQIAFRADDGRRYRIVERGSADSAAVLASGAVVLPRGDNLQMATGFGRLGPVTWSYGFQASRAVFTLRAGSRPFLQTLFPNTAWSEGLDVEMTLAPTDE